MPAPSESDCRGCQGQFLSQDLGEGLCVTCFDKVPQYWEKPRQTMFVLLSEEEKKQRLKARKQTYRGKNKARLVVEQQDRRVRLRERRNIR